MVMPLQPAILASSATAIAYSPYLVNIAVGPLEAQKTYTLPACYLTHRSLFFATSLASARYTADSSTTSSIPTIDLPDCSPATFDLYTQLIFTNTLPIQNPLEAAALANSTPTAPAIVDVWLADRYGVLIDLYVLASSLHDTAAQNAVLSAIVTQSLMTYTITMLFVDTEKGRKHFNTTMRFPSPVEVKRVYEATVPSSGIRRLMVDFWMANREYWVWWMTDVEGDGFDKEFLRDLVETIAQEATGEKRKFGWTREGVDMTKYYEGGREESRERVDSAIGGGENVVGDGDGDEQQ